MRVGRQTDRHPRIAHVPHRAQIPLIEHHYVAADTFTPYKSERHNDKIKEDGMGGTCSTNVGEENFLQDVNGEI